MGLMALRSYIGTLDGCLVAVVLLAALTTAACEFANGLVMKAVARRSWWPRAEVLMKQLMMSFGFSEEQCTPDINLEAYSFVIVNSADHLLLGASMLLVVLLGWSEAGPSWQLLFLLAALGHLAYDVYDSVKRTLLTFWPSACRCLGAGSPLTYWVIQVCLHHPLTLLLVVPMNLKYSHLPEYHRIACSLLLAAGIGFMAGQYKFTLSVSDRRECLQHKAIVLIQFALIWFSRCFVWFPNVYTLLKFFHEVSDTPYFVGGIVGAVGMSLFNIVMLLDCTTAAIKWLPKPLPATEDEYDVLKSDVAPDQCHIITPTKSASLEHPHLLGSGKPGKPPLSPVAEEKGLQEPVLAEHQEP